LEGKGHCGLHGTELGFLKLVLIALLDNQWKLLEIRARLEWMIIFQAMEKKAI